jgi:hypothetical protein
MTTNSSGYEYDKIAKTVQIYVEGGRSAAART